MSLIDIQFEKQIDNSRIVREVDTRCRVEYLCLTLLGAVFVLGIFFYAWQQYQWIQYGYGIETAQRKIEELEEVGQQLRIERATLRNPQRIDSLARLELGMVGPGVGQVVSVRVNDAFPSEIVPETTLVAKRIP
jgi:cell division protein FtsL